MAKPNESVRGPVVEAKRERRGVFAFFRESYLELKKVRWPNRRELVSFTAAALVFTLVMGLLVTAFDLIVSRLMSLIGLI
ncbi:MAG: preprotein translocase subunit SecE [Thermoflavifilum sp.]|nr:preprotein translocase subunit SecE [Thermoflavifilum sp.]MCL6513562.1 preprotein translocase subunit SecE [Alicyclobacillus sp.]